MKYEEEVNRVEEGNRRRGSGKLECDKREVGRE